MYILKENEPYQEIKLFVKNTKIGKAEINIKGKMLFRLIFKPYQNKGYGQKFVEMLFEKYSCDVLWVNADNNKAIHAYEKCGFRKTEPTMYKMEVTKMDKE